MGYDRDYSGLPLSEADDLAIDDVRGYLSEKQWDALMEMVGMVNRDDELVRQGRLSDSGQLYQFGTLNMALGMAGVQGWPVHAVGRRFCKSAYLKWRRSGADAVECDDEGFTEKERARHPSQ